MNIPKLFIGTLLCVLLFQFSYAQNVGIGTNNPSELLHLKSEKSAVLLLEADTDNITETDQPRVEFSQDGGIIRGIVGFAGGTNHLTIQNNWDNPDADIEFVTDSISRVTIDGIGNVGIGTKAPVEKITLANGNMSVNSNYGVVTGWGGGSEYAYLPNANGIQAFTGIGANAPFDFGTQIRSDALVAFIESDADKVVGWMNLNNNNFVWNGRISSSSVLVQTNVWADYVFKKDYKLKSLNEVEQFIQLNGHLPNTPNQEEVTTNGIDVSKMTVLQQEKIEELFLHVIELNKRLEVMEENNEKLKIENQQLKQNNKN